MLRFREQIMNVAKHVAQAKSLPHTSKAHEKRVRPHIHAYPGFVTRAERARSAT